MTESVKGVCDAPHKTTPERKISADEARAWADTGLAAMRGDPIALAVMSLLETQGERHDRLAAAERYPSTGGDKKTNHHETADSPLRCMGLLCGCELENGR